MARLRDLGEWSGGNTPSKANAAYWVDGTIPWVSPKDMKVDEITSSGDRVSEAALKEGRVSLVPEGSVLIVTRSGILSHTLPVAVTKTPVTINQDLKALSPKPGVLPKYVAHALRGASRRILNQCSKHGTTVASIETKGLLDFEIPLVDLDEQRRIVAEIEKQFSRLDEAVANLKRVKANLARCRASSLIRAMGDWPLVPVGRLCNCIVPNRDKPSEFTGSTPWLTLPDFDDDEIAIGRSRQGLGLSDREIAASRAKVVPAGSVLMSCVGRFGVTAVLQCSAVINQQLHAFLPSDRVIPVFLAYALRTRVAEMERKATATTIAYMNKSNCNSISVPLPPLDEQLSIVAEVDRRLSIVREVEAEVDANLKRAQVLRQAVLARAFDGAEAAVPFTA